MNEIEVRALVAEAFENFARYLLLAGYDTDLIERAASYAANQATAEPREDVPEPTPELDASPEVGAPEAGPGVSDREGPSGL